MDILNEINDILLLENNPSFKLEKLMKEDRFINSDFNILNELKNIPQDKEFHPEGNVWNHTKMVIDIASKIKDYSNNRTVFMWAALFHDIGKIKTTKFIKGRYRSYNHDIEGEETALKLFKKYISEEEAISISEIVRFHMHHIYILKDLPFSDIEKLIKSNNYHDIILLFVCDKLGRGNQNLQEKIKTVDDVILILNKLKNNYQQNNEEIIFKIEDIKESLKKDAK